MPKIFKFVFLVLVFFNAEARPHTRLDHSLMNKRALDVYGCHVKIRSGVIADVNNFEVTFAKRYDLSDPNVTDKMSTITKRHYTAIKNYGFSNAIFIGIDELRSCMKEVREFRYPSPDTVNFVTQYELDAVYCYNEFIDDMDALRWLRSGAEPENLSTVFVSAGKSKSSIQKHLESLQSDMEKNGLLAAQLKLYENYLTCSDNVHNSYQDVDKLKARARGY